MRRGRSYRSAFAQPEAGGWGWVLAGVLLILVGGTLWWLWRGPGSGGPAGDGGAQSGSAGPGEDLTIWFASRQEDALVAEKRRLPPLQSPVERARASLQELIAGPKGDALRTIPAEVKIRELFIDTQGAAYVDFTEGFSQTHPGGPWAELLTLRSIMQTLVANVPEIKRVQILIEGHEMETLAGHIDIRRPLDTTWGMNQR